MNTNPFLKYGNILGLFWGKKLDIYYILRFLGQWYYCAKSVGLSNDQYYFGHKFLKNLVLSYDNHRHSSIVL